MITIDMMTREIVRLLETIYSFDSSPEEKPKGQIYCDVLLEPTEIAARTIDDLSKNKLQAIAYAIQEKLKEKGAMFSHPLQLPESTKPETHSACWHRYNNCCVRGIMNKEYWIWNKDNTERKIVIVRFDIAWS